MRSIQFHHKRQTIVQQRMDGISISLSAKGGTTLCLEVPTIEEFDALEPSLFKAVIFKFGVAECSKKDNYNKKLGREIAKGRLKDTYFFVTMKSANEMQLAGGDYFLVLRKREGKVRVYFEGVVG